MAVMASWNGRTWEVSGQKILTLEGIQATKKLKTQTDEDMSGSAPTANRGLELQSFSFSFRVAAMTGVDVLAEHAAWEALLGEFAPFYLGANRFGPENLQLQEVSLGETTTDPLGRVLVGTITIKLTEYAPEPAKAKAKSSGGGKSAVAANSSGYVVPEELQRKRSALDIAPTMIEKAKLKVDDQKLARLQ